MPAEKNIQGEIAEKIIVALDVDTKEEADALVKELMPTINFFKVGLRLYTACGPGIITALKKLGVRLFLDLKFYDIPSTVATAARVVTHLGVDMFNIHLSGGRNMARATVEAVQAAAGKENRPLPLILGVTVLSSLNEKMLKEEIGILRGLEEHVLKMVSLGQENGLNGVVVSPREVGLVRKKCGPGFLIVAPGVRPSGAARHDQLRVLTPRQALAAGASYLVIGRPIITAPSPRAAAEIILAQMSNK